MSTRAQIGFYETNEKDLTKWEALIYRHSDGYPDGVLPDIVPFLKWWNKERGPDSEYGSARLLQYLCNKYDKAMEEMDKDAILVEKPQFTGTLEHGICKGFHGDIEYFYAIRPDRLEVYKVPCDENPSTWQLEKTIKLASKVVR